MATYTWSIPVGNQITGSTKVKDTDNFLANTVDDLVDFVNGEGTHSGQGLAYDLVDKASSQTLTGQKTFSSAIIASGGVTGNVIGDVTGNITGNSATATKLATARTISISGGASGSVSFDGSANADIVVSQIVPAGVIVLWSGSSASIPSGWYLCNGLNGTPNLMDRFVVGAGSSYSVGGTGGSKDAVLVSHTHTYSGTSSTASLTGTIDIGNPFNATGVFTGISERGIRPGLDWASGSQSRVSFDASHNHTYSGTTSATGSSGTDANLPPYYALCYIMKA